EPARPIFDAGAGTSTIGNIINVLPDGTLIDSFDLNFGRGQRNVALVRSTDHGITWDANPTFVDQHGTIGVVDPRDGTPVRTGDTIASAALETDLWMTRSTDGGRTYTRRERITPSSFDMRAAPVVGARGFFIGDYTGLVDGRIIDAEYVATTGDPANLTDTFA